MTGRTAARATWLRTGLVLVCVVATDQLVKALVTDSLQRGEQRDIVAGIEQEDGSSR